VWAGTIGRSLTRIVFFVAVAMKSGPPANPFLARIVRRGPHHRARDKRIAFMARSKHPTANSLLAQAARHGMRVRWHYSDSGKIDWVDANPKIDGVAANGEAVDDLDRELKEFEERNGQA
jgi:hypothetical protein